MATTPLYQPNRPEFSPQAWFTYAHGRGAGPRPLPRSLQARRKRARFTFSPRGKSTHATVTFGEDAPMETVETVETVETGVSRWLVTPVRAAGRAVGGEFLVTDMLTGIIRRTRVIASVHERRVQVVTRVITGAASLLCLMAATAVWLGGALLLGNLALTVNTAPPVSGSQAGLLQAALLFIFAVWFGAGSILEVILIWVTGGTLAWGNSPGEMDDRGERGQRAPRSSWLR